MQRAANVQDGTPIRATSADVQPAGFFDDAVCEARVRVNSQLALGTGIVIGALVGIIGGVVGYVMITGK